jgi:hypothetical protein
METKAIVEILIVETDGITTAQRSRGLGYSVVPLFYESLPAKVEVWQGSPRDVLKHMNDPGFQPPLTLSELCFHVEKLDQEK